MDCTTALASMSAYLDGELAPRQATAFEEHMQTCDRCRMEFRMKQDDAAAIRRHATYFRAPSSLAARVGLALPVSGPRRAWIADKRLHWAALAASWLIAATNSFLYVPQVGHTEIGFLVNRTYDLPHHRHLFALPGTSVPPQVCFALKVSYSFGPPD